MQTPTYRDHELHTILRLNYFEDVQCLQVNSYLILSFSSLNSLATLKQPRHQEWYESCRKMQGFPTEC